MARRPRNGLPLKPKPDRRDETERRKVTRSGRRDADPQPRCPSCGLLVGRRPHASERECIAALREILERLINSVPLDDTLTSTE